MSRAKHVGVWFLILTFLGLLWASRWIPWGGSDDLLSRFQEQIERTPAWNEKPFAPADGAELTLTPPAFVWLPVPEAQGSYVLEVSRAENFAPTAETWNVDVTISVYVPTRCLGPGIWYWRVGVRDKTGQIVWSRVRQFTIAPNARAWPLPEVDFLRTQVPQDRPRLFFSAETLPRVRSTVPYTMEDEYERVWIEAERAVREPLPEEPAYVRAQGPARDAAFAKIFRATRPPMDAMETCALAYLLTGQRRFGLEAKRRVLHFFRWNPEGPTALTHNPEPAMWMMQRGVRAYDWTWDLWTPEERSQVEETIKIRARQFYQRLRSLPFESRPFHSHAARDLCFLGEVSLAFLHEWPEAPEWLHYVLSLFWSVYPAWGEEDGGWNEGPTYWTAYMDFALHFAVALKNATGVQLLEKPFFQNTVYYKLYANPPYARHSPFGDGQEYPPGPASGTVMYAFSTLLRNPYARWYTQQLRSGPGRGPLGFVLYDPDIPAQPPSDIPQTRYFPGVGLVAVHTQLANPKENIYLLFRSSPLGSISHAHADQNAFAIEAFGEALAIASGYYPYFNSPHHHQWTRQTKAACSITINGGQGQIVRSIEGAGRILAFATSPEYDYALGEASTAYGNRLRRFYRHLIHVRPGVFVIVDELSAPRPSRFEWWLHALEKMEVEPTKRQVLLHRGKARMEVTFLAPGRVQFEQTDRFTPPPENGASPQWHLTVSNLVKEKNIYFFTVLRPFQASQTLPPLEPLVEGTLVGVAWVEGGLRHEVLYDPRGIRRTDLGPIPAGCRLLGVQHRGEKISVWIPPCPNLP